MRIQPRQHLLETWRAVARASASEKSWNWGGQYGRSSISDAEQLLCLMGPATKVDAFKVDLPDETAEDVLKALAPLGDSVELPRRLIRVIGDYLRTYTDADGNPTFAGGSYFLSEDPARQPTETQLTLDVVDSLSKSVQLSLATIGFVRVFRTVITREDLRRQVDEVEAMASTRLSAAMVGLLRSYAVHVFDLNSLEGQTLCRTVNQSVPRLSQRRIVDELQQELREVNAGLRDLTLGAGDVADLDNPNRLFECGWSWGIVKGAPVVDTIEDVRRQLDGVAQAAPYLYFTVVALDGIPDLFTERTRILGLLNEEQHRLAKALQVRWELTQTYWAKIASFGDGRWPLEDIPWRTTDELESDYFTLLVTSIMAQVLSTRTGANADLLRVGRVLDDLASRGRITRRPFTNDPAIPQHTPGIAMPLVGSDIDGGPRLSWTAYDYSAQLLKRTLRVAGLLRTSSGRGQMLELSDRVWEHLWQRRHRTGAGSQLWDQPAEVFDGVKTDGSEPSWYYTERVIEALIAAATFVESAPLRSADANSLAADLLAEAEHLFDQELLLASAQAGPSMAAALQRAQTTIRRAKEIMPARPGTALVLASEVLRDLDRLAAARLSSTEVI